MENLQNQALDDDCQDCHEFQGGDWEECFEGGAESDGQRQMIRNQNDNQDALSASYNRDNRNRDRMSDRDASSRTAPINNIGLPPWMSADKITFWERMEIQIYKIISYIPVGVTFGVFIFLYIFYITVSQNLPLLLWSNEANVA